jgi:hypothetical protein
VIPDTNFDGSLVLLKHIWKEYIKVLGIPPEFIFPFTISRLANTPAVHVPFVFFYAKKWEEASILMYLSYEDKVLFIKKDNLLSEITLQYLMIFSFIDLTFVPFLKVIIFITAFIIVNHLKCSILYISLNNNE